MSSYEEHDPEAGSTPKMNKFTHEISDWLLLATACLFVVYGILYLFYEIALGMAHIRWVYNCFMLICLVDIVAYFLARFSVIGELNRCLLILTTIIYSITSLVNLVAPAIVLISYELTLNHPSTGGILEIQTSEEPADYIYGEQQASQDCGVDSTGFKCGVVKSIRTSVWCMYILLIPRPLLLYGIITVLKPKKNVYYEV